VSFLRRVENRIHLSPRGKALLLLSLPLAWLGIVYLGSLTTMLVQSFFYLDDFTGRVVREPTLATYAQLFTRANLDIILRTAAMALAVTVCCAFLAFPLSYYMSRYSSPRAKAALYLAVTLPLWSSYLVRVYSWKLILAKEGILSFVIGALQLDGVLELVLELPVIGGPSLSVSRIGTFLVFVYVWLPYMILPITAALDRVPRTLLEASADLGGKPGDTFKKITLPLALPGVVAGSIFTFSLTLGDYIIPGVLGNSSLFIGQAVLSHQGTSGNIPLAAAFTVVPMVIMALYLTAARKLGAFEAL
jgi:putative spermidine/putrescine transport system permease protein